MGDEDGDGLLTQRNILAHGFTSHPRTCSCGSCDTLNSRIGSQHLPNCLLHHPEKPGDVPPAPAEATLLVSGPHFPTVEELLRLPGRSCTVAAAHHTCFLPVRCWASLCCVA
ncbi:hypothetical protein NDU88_000044 [Pleurodeles waltl]|uniref:Uncharacterized protein n=1 Tax=Pleurodeles waltl TaxID=8319 RepID=A0AAV7TEE0_PLEWA|nr:hypothetical protein NDU88_000044 [Pleurodeles waltl]